MLRVRMKTHITGYRNEQPWPQAGGELDLPDHEAHDLAGNGYADIIGAATDEPADDGLDQLGVRKLRSLVRDTPDLEVPKTANKGELVDAIRAHQAAEAEAHAAALAAAQGGDPDGGPDSQPAGDTGGSTPPPGGSDGPPAGTSTGTGGDPGTSSGA